MKLYPTAFGTDMQGRRATLKRCEDWANALEPPPLHTVSVWLGIASLLNLVGEKTGKNKMKHPLLGILVMSGKDNNMNKITDPKKIKEYVISTIRSGDKDRIQKVLMRYFSVMKEKEQKNTASVIEEAKRVFGV